MKSGWFVRTYSGFQFSGIKYFHRNPKISQSIHIVVFKKWLSSVLSKNTDCASCLFFFQIPIFAPVKGTIKGCASPMACKSSGWLEIALKWSQTATHQHWRQYHSQDMESNSRLKAHRLNKCILKFCSQWCPPAFRAAFFFFSFFFLKYPMLLAFTPVLTTEWALVEMRKQACHCVALSGHLAGLDANQWTQLMFQWTPGTDSAADALIG